MKRHDLYIAVFFAFLIGLYFSPVLFGHATLIPFDNLFRFPPWSVAANQLGVTQPHNELLSDLVLENYAWKRFILESLKQGELPLWNPYLFAGVPFLAAGQHSALYPFSILFYILPLERAYGIFIALHLWIAALAMYAFLRTLGAHCFGGIVGGITYAFSGFMLVSVVFPMVISAAAWLPAILACLERVFLLRERRARGGENSIWREIFWTLLAALLIGLQFLAGHIEVSYYILLVTALFALWGMIRLARVAKQERVATLLSAGIFAVASIGLGIALAGVQIIPLYELLQLNFRVGSQPYETIIGYAFPLRQVLTFFLPDFFGNPVHHSYLDAFDFTIHAAPTGTIFWGTKNYVEAGAYVGILPIVLAFIAVLAIKSDTSYTPFFTLLGILSLLFTFGTPLYAILFYGLPGVNQLHTPFRWVFPYTLAVAVLAGLGAHSITDRHKNAGAEKHDHIPASLPQRLSGSLAWTLIVVSALVLLGLGASWLERDLTLSLARRVLDWSDLARAVFSDERMFYSYQARNVLLFALFTLGAGLAVRYLVLDIPIQISRGAIPLGQVLTVFVITIDLFVIFFDFYPRADPKLREYVPPAVEFLQQDKSLFRISTYDSPNEKVMNPNVGLFYGLYDIRGYDSIIPKQYTEYMSLLAAQDELIYNRVAAFSTLEPLSSPLLNLLSVKYVLTRRPVTKPGYTLVYDREIKIYQNDNAIPNAFLVTHARVTHDEEEKKRALLSFDPRNEVLLEEDIPEATESSFVPSNSAATIINHGGTLVKIKTETSQDTWLVLTDSYFPGWRAYVDEQETHIYRADGNFRALRVPGGEHIVRFSYSPLSLRIGAVVSLIAGLVIGLGFVTVTWQRLYRGEARREGVQLIAKNSLIPIGTALINQLLAFAFLPFLLRVLGPENNGRYYFAVTTWFFLSTLTDFGLGILVTREVSRDRALANRYLTNTVVLRILLLLASLPILLTFLFIYRNFLGMSGDTATTILILWTGLLPFTVASAMSYMFNAFEQFEYPNVVTVATALVSTALQAAVLLLGGGIIGLAIVSIASNLFTLVLIYSLVRSRLFAPRWEWDSRLIRWMIFESYPLMLNNLLANLFFKIDVFILGPLKGDTVLGLYGTAYKFINALNVIPSNFTLALFPRFARQALESREAMLRVYLISLKLLLWVALPIVVGTLFVAREVIAFFGGSEYLPGSQIALQWLIWFLPFSFINSLTHYVLIALNQQRFLTKAFIIGLVFNIAANLLAIPPLSYRGAALVTVLSELALLAPFYYSLRRQLAPVNFVALAWKPSLAAFAMGVAIYSLGAYIGLVFALVAGSAAYVTLLYVLRAVGAEERNLFWRLLRRTT